jgi:hypothetical protein
LQFLAKIWLNYRLIFQIIKKQGVNLMISYYFGDYQLYTNNLDIYGKIEDIK